MSSEPPPPPSGSGSEKRKRSPSASGTEASTATATNSQCQVCGDVASIINYGALSCLSCRTFFRRNAYPNREVVPCRFDGRCEVTVLSRRSCTGCRLNKCLAVGMSRDLIRKEDLTVSRKKETKLTTTTTTTTTTRNTTTTTAITTVTTIDESQRHLTPLDRTLISNIRHAFETYSHIASIQNRLAELTPPVEVTVSVDIVSSTYQSLKSVIYSIPDFQILTSEEQASLIQRNLFGVLFLGSIYILRASGLFNQSEHEPILLQLYGTEYLQQTKSIAERMPSDPMLFHVLLIALAFSSNCHLLSLPSDQSSRDSLLFGTFRLFGSQNVYVELLWKYVLESSPTFTQAVQLLSNLIRHLMDTLRLAQEIYEKNPIHRTCLDEIFEHNQNVSVRIPLWGKK